MHDWKGIIAARIAPLEVDPAREADIVAELAQHLAEHYAELTAGGVPEGDALSRVVAPLNDPDQLAAAIARADRPRRVAPPPPPMGRPKVFMDTFRDLQYALRVLRQAPGFTAAAVITLALGIGANTAIFSVLHAVLLAPLPYAGPDRLVTIGERSSSGRSENIGFLTFSDWRNRTHGFEEMSLIRSWTPTLMINGEPERLPAMRVSWNFFRMLGVRPAIGRDFRADEDAPDRWRELLISDGLWRRRFGADPNVLERVVTMNDRQYTIVGVLPAGFEPLISERFYQAADMWAPLGYGPDDRSACRTCRHLKALARLADNTTLDAAQKDLDSVQTALQSQFPKDYDKKNTAVVPLSDELTRGLKPALVVLMGAVGLLLLIACANVASLLLARLSHRRYDFALRTALGASRARLIRQLLAETFVLAAIGGLAGVALSVLTVPALTSLAPPSMARLTTAQVDPSVIAFSAAVSLGTALLFGLLPAFGASRVSPGAGLVTDRRRTSRSPTSLARRALVAVDVALAVVLLAGASLMIASVARLLSVDPGFKPGGVLSMQISLVGQAYAEDPVVALKTDELVAALRAIPGVESAAAAGQIPLGGNFDCWGFFVEGRPAGPTSPCVQKYSVTPDYFTVMRIPLVSGRVFTMADRRGAEDVMLVGEHTAQALWPGENPIGRRVRIGDADKGPWRTIVGIVGDVRHEELSAGPLLTFYTSQAQQTDSFLTMVVRTSGEPSRLLADARRAVWSVARDIPVYSVSTLDDLVAKSVGQRRFVMLLLGCFAILALVMTAVGLYSVIAYTVNERAPEIGLRAALGATRADVVRLVLSQTVPVIGVGLAAGIVVALVSTQLLKGSLYGVSASDPVTYSAVLVLLVGVAVFAQLVPVGRALRVDPSVVLRQ